MDKFLVASTQGAAMCAPVPKAETSKPKQGTGKKPAAPGISRAKLEERMRQMSEERKSLMAKQKELQWDKDQDSKRLAKEIARIGERADQERSEHLQLVEKLKQDIKERHTMELTSKQ